MILNLVLNESEDVQKKVRHRTKEGQNQAGSHVGYERGFFHNSRGMRSCAGAEYRWYIPPGKCTAYR